MQGDEELCYLTVAEALRRFRRRALSPAELVRALITRSERLDPALNAYTRTYYEQALRSAEAAERSYGRTGSAALPLEGIPIVVKEMHPVAGEVTTFGCRALEEHRSPDTAPGVRRLLEAGAIMLARSSTPEFGISATCNTPLWGVTRNPWNPTCSPGSSSSGGAAALAAGMTVLSDGSDYGGSIRAPAGFCGVFGYKPPYGRNPGITPFDFDSLGVYGVLTRTVRDAALLQNVLSGDPSYEMVGLPQTAGIPERFSDRRSWRIAFSLDLGYFEVADGVKRNTHEVLEALRTLGCRVDEVEVGWTLDTLAAFEVHATAAFAATWSERLARYQEDLTPLVRFRLRNAANISAEALYRTLHTRADMCRRLMSILGRYDAFVCPTNAVEHLPAEESPLEDAYTEIHGHTISLNQQVSLAYPFNLLNQLPVASVPSGFSTMKVPTAIQIVGRPYDDITVFELASTIERIRPWPLSAGEQPAHLHPASSPPGSPDDRRR